MVVRNYHRHRTKPNRLAEDVAWMQKGLVRSASRHDHWFAEKMALRVKVEGVGAFLRFVDANRPHLPHDVVRSLNRTRERAVRCPNVTFHKRERGGKLYSGDLADAWNLRRDDLLPRRIDKIRRAPEVPDQPVGKVDCARSLLSRTDENSQQHCVRKVPHGISRTHERLSWTGFRRQVLYLERLTHVQYYTTTELRCLFFRTRL